MGRCVICASSLEPDTVACPECGSTADFMDGLRRRAMERRFLFGRVEEPPAPEPEPEPRQLKVKRQKPERPLKTHDQGQDLPPPAREPMIEPVDQVVLRDVIKPVRPAESDTSFRPGAYTIDIVLCLFLNWVILRLVLWVIFSDFSTLITHGLVPLLFVFISFTALYFYLFIGLLQKSPGQLFLDLITRGQRR